MSNLGRKFFALLLNALVYGSGRSLSQKIEGLLSVSRVRCPRNDRMTLTAARDGVDFNRGRGLEPITTTVDPPELTGARPATKPRTCPH
jgi:hypothetical protein